MAESGRKKRTAPSAPFAGAGSDEASVDELQARLDALFRPVDSSCIHNLSSADGKKQLASQMWIGGFDEQIARLRADNFMLVSVLQAQSSPGGWCTVEPGSSTKSIQNAFNHDRAQHTC